MCSFDAVFLNLLQNLAIFPPTLILLTISQVSNAIIIVMLVSLFLLIIDKRIISGVLLFILGILLFGCLAQPIETREKLIIGVVSYEQGTYLVEKYQDFQDYLAAETKTVVELEPAFNERQVIARIERREWSIIFADPGLAAIAIEGQGYIPIFPLAGNNSQNSLIVVKDDSNLQDLVDLSQKTIALGQPGSATGYYLPLYDLFGLTLAEVRFAPTPRTILQWLEKDVIDAGAISGDKLNLYRSEFTTQFRILHQTRLIPSGSVLINPDLDPQLQEKIKTVMKQAPTFLTKDIGYLPHAPVPDYQHLISLVDQVKFLESKLNDRPVILTKD